MCSLESLGHSVAKTPHAWKNITERHTRKEIITFNTEAERR